MTNNIHPSRSTLPLPRADLSAVDPRGRDLVHLARSARLAHHGRVLSHKATLTVSADRVLRLQLPDELLPGAVIEVTVSSAALPQDLGAASNAEVAPTPAVEEAFLARFPRVPELIDGVILHEDPTLPLDQDDWGRLAG
jgi:hypothetical protein